MKNMLAIVSLMLCLQRGLSRCFEADSKLEKLEKLTKILETQCQQLESRFENLQNRFNVQRNVFETMNRKNTLKIKMSEDIIDELARKLEGEDYKKDRNHFPSKMANHETEYTKLEDIEANDATVTPGHRDTDNALGNSNSRQWRLWKHKDIYAKRTQATVLALRNMTKSLDATDTFKQVKRQNSGPIAFHVYLRKNQCYNVHQTFIFDAEETNVGDNYNLHDGVFTVPTAGTYVFTVTVAAYPNRHVQAEIVVDSVVKGVAFADATGTQQIATSTATVVVNVNIGSHVYVRKGGNFADCALVSDYCQTASHVRTTFSGWSVL